VEHILAGHNRVFPVAAIGAVAPVLPVEPLLTGRTHQARRAIAAMHWLTFFQRLDPCGQSIGHGFDGPEHRIQQTFH
jgi:hypothetical protein